MGQSFKSLQPFEPRLVSLPYSCVFLPCVDQTDFSDVTTDVTDQTDVTDITV